MASTAAWKKRVRGQTALKGVLICWASKALAATSASMGVNSRKLLLLTRVISRSGSRA